MDKKDLAVATITWARNEPEETLLRKALEPLASLEIPVFITDGGSGPGFLNFLHQFPHFRIASAKEKGVWAQARSSVLLAYEAKPKYILYTEPDKQEFFLKYLNNFLAAAPFTEKVGIVLASRSTAGFATFPPFQQTTETAINNCCTEIIGKAVDYTYGPFLLNPLLAPYLNLVQEDIGWGWRPYLFGLAHRLGYSVNHVEADFQCPLDQQEDSPSERIYRMRQLSQNIHGLVLSTSIPLD